MGRTSGIPAGVCLLLVVAGGALADESRIHYAEPVSIGPGETSGTPEAQGKPASLNLSFQAFAQTFELQLEPNDRLVARLPAHLADSLSRHRLYRGRLLSHAGSWARISNVAGDWRGVVFDGRELYAIVPASQVRELLVDPTSATDAGTVIYRLSDIETGFGPGSCGVVGTDGGHDSLKYGELVDELRESLAQAVPIEGEIEIATIADFEFSQAYGAGAVDEVLLRVNIVDGIYAEQVGIAITVPELRVFTDPDDPFTTSDMSSLLEQFASYRETTPAVRDRGLAQLFSGRTATGPTIGIAFIDSLCQPRRGASVTLAARDPMSAALIAAHEIGHNFGAPHDSEDGSACQATPPFFIMAPQLNGSREFSPCSLDRMRPAINRASCITDGNVADAGVSGPTLIANAVVGEAFEHAVTVTSRGTVGIDAVTVLLFAEWGSGVALESIDAEGGTCAPAGPNVQCSLGTMAAGTTRRIALRVRPLRIGLQTILSRVDAPGDRVSSNNTSNVEFTTIAAADVAVQLNVVNIQALTRTPLSFSATVRSLGPRDALGVQFNFGFGSFLEIDAASVSGGTCSFDSNTVSCSLGTIPAGQSRTIDLQAHGLLAGTFTGGVGIFSSNGFQSGNDQGEIRFSLTSAADVAASRDTTPLIVGIDSAFDFTMRVSSLGPQSVNGVQALVGADNDMVIESASVAGVDCAAAGNSRTCMLGTMPDEQTRDILVRARITKAGFRRATLRVIATNDDNQANDLGDFLLQARHRVDVSMAPIVPTARFETRPFTVTVPVTSVGLDTATDVSVTATLPAAMVLVSAALDGGSCTTQPQMFACSRAALARDAVANLTLELRVDQTGHFNATLNAAALNDAAPANGVSILTVDVFPFFDARVTMPGTVEALRATEFDYEVLVSAGARPLTDVVLEVSSVPVILVGLTADTGGVCTGPPTATLRCTWASLASNATVRAILRLRAIAPGQVSGGRVTVFAAQGDGDVSNNQGSFSLNINIPSEVFLFPEADVSGRLDQNLTHEVLVSTVHGAQPVTAVETVFTLPASIALVSINAEGGTCNTGAANTTCMMGTLPSGVQRRIVLTVRPSIAGTFNGQATVTGVGDTALNDNSQIIRYNIQAALPPPSSGGGGGGGGGSLGLLSLLALACATHRRTINRSAPADPSRPPAAPAALAARSPCRPSPRAPRLPSSWPRA